MSDDNWSGEYYPDNLAEWVKVFHPEIADVFQAWNDVNFTLVPGQWVETLVWGFSGGPGKRCQYLRTTKQDVDGGSWTHLHFGYVEDNIRKAETRWMLSPDSPYAKNNIYLSVMPIDAPSGG